MTEFLQKLSGGELIAMTFWLVMGLTWLTSIVANQWRRARKAELELMLKQDMLQRGMSADDIVKVLKASQGGSQPTDPNPPSAT
ncbi:MAG: hypothetical protein IAG10_04405 [Planctomycetaceae bacterium]|nr:hypothetical protein [Planctomycetaceae bacterium]